MKLSKKLSKSAKAVRVALQTMALPGAMVLIGSLSACGFTNYVPGFVSPYKYDIQQGNFITKEMVAQLKPGLTRDQVRFALGTPLITDAFHADRWDYVFRMQKANGKVEFTRYVVVFKENALDRFGGSSDLPTEIDAATAKTDTGAAAGLIAGTSTAPELPVEPSNKGDSAPSIDFSLNPAPAENTSTAAPLAAATAEPNTAPSAAATPPAKLIPPLPPEITWEVTQDKPAAQHDSNTNAKILGTLDGWVGAWSAKNVDAYLSFYAPNFRHGMQDRSVWENFRRRRLSNPSNIQIEMLNPKVLLRGNSLAEVTFEQRYKSNILDETGTKTLELILIGGEWKILRETFVVLKS